MDSPPWLMIVKCLAVSRLSRASLEDDPPWNGITVFLGFHVLIGFPCTWCLFSALALFKLITGYMLGNHYWVVMVKYC